MLSIHKVILDIDSACVLQKKCKLIARQYVYTPPSRPITITEQTYLNYITIVVQKLYPKFVTCNHRTPNLNN